MKVTLGLGVMGYLMAGHLAKAGHEVTVYNRTTAKADQWAAELVTGCDNAQRRAGRAGHCFCLCW